MAVQEEFAKACGLLDLAYFHIGRKEYSETKKIAEDLASVGNFGFSACIYTALRMPDEAKALMVPLAEKWHDEGNHLMEASYYNRVGMEKECLDALKH